MRKSHVLHPLAWALLGGGLAVMTTAGAIDLPWLYRATPAAAASAVPAAVAAAAPGTPALAATAQPAPLPALPPAATPNYRAIVLQYGPAVVGVTVEGTR